LWVLGVLTRRRGNSASLELLTGQVTIGHCP
jgi:hypothetical protein